MLPQNIHRKKKKKKKIRRNSPLRSITHGADKLHNDEEYVGVAEYLKQIVAPTITKGIHSGVGQRVGNEIKCNIKVPLIPVGNSI